MIRSVNLLSITAIQNELVKKSYLKYIGSEERHTDELPELSNFAKLLDSNSIATDKFYIFYQIPQIGKEFDLLAFNANKDIINIELKNDEKYTEAQISKQLLRNKYYLNSVSSNVKLYTFNSATNKVYTLLNDNTLQVDLIDESSKFIDSVLYKSLIDFENINLENIDSLFSPSKFLVSPFNDGTRFLNGEYFLTNEQETIKKFILKGDFGMYGIPAPAGTGKTLLVYDIAKELIKESKKVCIVHVGQLNQGHLQLSINPGWKIVSIKDFSPSNYVSFDCIIFDEIQHANKHTIIDILNELRKFSIDTVLSGDPKQIIDNNDIGKEYVSYIKENYDNKHVKTLSRKIRTNKPVASFIKRLFNLKDTAGSENISYNNISLTYFDNKDDAVKYATSLIPKWNVLNYTTSRYKIEYNDIFRSQKFFNQHKIIGQEFDNVAIFMGSDYYYENNHLKVHTDKESYYPTRMGLFENVTRTRINLKLIICNNEELLNNCINIIE